MPDASRDALRAEAEVRESGPWAPVVDQLDPVQRAVLVEFKLLKEDGRTPVVTDYARENKRWKSKISPEAVLRLLALDTTKDHRWTRWIFFQAGGGEPAVAVSRRTKETLKVIFYEKNRQRHAQDPAQIDSEWARQLQTLEVLLDSGDEDTMKKVRGTFGFAYSFPGEEGRYELCEKTVSRFMRVYKKGARMNKELEERGDSPVPMSPDEIKNLNEMEVVTVKVARYYASIAARDDVRVAEWPDPSNRLWKAEPADSRRKWKKDEPTWKKRKTVYDDDFVTVVVPLTYAAAVEYGSDAWDVSNTAKFRSALATAQGNDPWSTLDGIVAFVTFNVPMPASLKHRDEQVGLTTLQRLMVLVRGNDVVFFDTSKSQYAQEDIEAAILSEVERPQEPDADYGELPIDRGANVYKTPEEAMEVVRHFRAAMRALGEWIARNSRQAGFAPKPFDPNYV